MKQETFTDMEYSSRKKKTKREEFLEIIVWFTVAFYNSEQ